MSLWGNKDYVTGNQKPLFANTITVGANVSSNSTINGKSANLVYGSVYGVSVTEVANSGSIPVTHSGWVSVKTGTGGRAGRVFTETLVAMGSVTDDDPKDNTNFPGV